jgi:uncharacterized protein YjiS (DUF1127 family)
MEPAMTAESKIAAPTTGTTAALVVFGLVLGIAGRLRRIGQALKNRRDARLLAEFDSHMLADIGLTRSDLHDAYSEPLWCDPTAILVNRVKERRDNQPKGRIAVLLTAPSLAPEVARGTPLSRTPTRHAA